MNCDITIRKESVYIPQKGDFVYFKSVQGFEDISIYEKKFKNIHCTYISLYNDGRVCNHYNCISSHISDDNVLELRKATEEEKEELLKIIDEEGFYWDDTLKELCPKPKEGDLCIFWNYDIKDAGIGILDKHKTSGYGIGYYIDRNQYINCIKFKSEEQFKKLIRYEQ